MDVDAEDPETRRAGLMSDLWIVQWRLSYKNGLFLNVFFSLLASNAKRERGAERKREYTLTQLNSSVDKKEVCCHCTGWRNCGWCLCVPALRQWKRFPARSKAHISSLPPAACTPYIKAQTCIIMRPITSKVFSSVHHTNVTTRGVRCCFISHLII